MPVTCASCGLEVGNASLHDCVPAKAGDVGPAHYKDMDIEPWDVIDTWPLEQRIGAYRAAALKYVMRMGRKDECAKEIKKAEHYCRKLQEVLEGK